MALDFYFGIVPRDLLRSEASDKAVRLFAHLWDHADREEHQTTIRLAVLADEMRCSVDSVRRAMRELEEIGAVNRVEEIRPDQSQAANTYSLSSIPPPGTGATPATFHPREGAPGTHATPKKKNQSSEPIEQIRASFDAFWKDYPRRGGRRAGVKSVAIKVWAKMKPEQRAKAMKALPNYAAECNGYPKDAERYLRHEVYENFLEPLPDAPEEDGYVRL